MRARVTWRILLLLLAAVPLAGCGGPIAAPAEVVDLSQSSVPFQERFDAARGEHRLVLVLSPA